MPPWIIVGINAILISLSDDTFIIDVKIDWNELTFDTKTVAKHSFWGSNKLISSDVLYDVWGSQFPKHIRLPWV